MAFKQWYWCIVTGFEAEHYVLKTNMWPHVPLLIGSAVGTLKRTVLGPVEGVRGSRAPADLRDGGGRQSTTATSQQQLFDELQPSKVQGLS